MRDWGRTTYALGVKRKARLFETVCVTPFSTSYAKSAARSNEEYAGAGVPEATAARLVVLSCAGMVR